MYVNLEANRMWFFLNDKKIHYFKIPHGKYIPAVDVFKTDVRTLNIPDCIPEEILN